MPRLRLAVLVSGRGSNLESLLAASREGRMDAEIALVVSNKADAPALDVARAHGVRAEIVASQGVAREEHETKIATALDAARVDLVVLAGYMRVLTPAFIQRYHGRMVNVHPSLLPAFPGVDAQGQAHARGVRIAGCTTHFVTEEVDGGPIVAQAAVAIPPGADAEEIRRLVLDLEHRILPATIDLIASGKVRLVEGRVIYSGLARAHAQAITSPEVPL